MEWFQLIVDLFGVEESDNGFKSRFRTATDKNEYPFRRLASGAWLLFFSLVILAVFFVIVLAVIDYSKK